MTNISLCCLKIYFQYTSELDLIVREIKSPV